MTLRDLNKHLGKLVNRVRLMVGRGIVKLVDDSGGLQTIQMEALKDEILTNIERFQNYGFTSHPPSGSECVFLALAGKRDNVVIVAMDNQEYRLKDQEEGEVAVHGLGLEDQCLRFFKDNNDATLRVAGTLTIEAGDFKMKRIT